MNKMKFSCLVIALTVITCVLGFTTLDEDTEQIQKLLRSSQSSEQDAVADQPRRRLRHGLRSRGLGDFLVTDILDDGEREIRIRFKGVTAKETFAGTKGDGLILRQLTDGRHFIQMITNANEELIDCEHVTDATSARNFLRTFRKELGLTKKERQRMKEKSEMITPPPQTSTTSEDPETKIDINIIPDEEEEDEDEKRKRKLYELKRQKQLNERKKYMKPKNNKSWNSDETDENTGMSKWPLEPEVISIGRNQDAFKDEEELEVNSRKKRFVKPLTFDKRAPARDRRSSLHLRNVTYTKLNPDSQLPRNLQKWLNYGRMADLCDSLHEQLKKDLEIITNTPPPTKEFERLERSRRSILIVPGTLWCGAGQSAEHPNQLGLLKSLDSCCRQHDACPGIQPWTKDNMSPFTISHCSCDKSVPERKPGSRVGLFPGTNWCGRGNSASRYSHVGPFAAADRCCRAHDTSCPFWIQTAETKYGIFNWRPNTLMHCRCDERFRTCLKMADTEAANMVGRLFFNIVQTKCFVLKPEPVCLQRSWWGKCLQVGYSKRAHLRDNVPY